jgi:tRNA pseudouridine55 synthase
VTYQTDGILLIDKNEAETSYEVVRMVKSALKIKKVGHAGTLDPFATGLLIILLGQGTKLSPFVMSENKVYLATMRLGIETDTLDSTGRVVRKSAVPDLSVKHIREKAEYFVGDIEQTPPLYSAVKYKGTRAYKLARRGQEFVLKKRTVTIFSLRILSVDLPDVTLEVKCSSGTYIRSLAADLGEELGPGGHLKSLRRLACGSFYTEDALCSKEISTGNNGLLLRDKVIPLRAALPNMREIEVEHDIAEKIRHGYQPALEGLADGLDLAGCEGTHLKLVSNSELVAVMKVTKCGRGGHGRLDIVRVFS